MPITIIINLIERLVWFVISQSEAWWALIREQETRHPFQKNKKTLTTHF